jgi:hypothetical protein
MDNIKQVSKNLKRTERESAHNVRRMAENFNKPERTVHSFNQVHPYTHTFVTPPNATAHLNLKINPLTVPCTVNPPILNVQCTVNMAFDNPGVLFGLSSTSSVDPPNPDFVQEGSNSIILPVDGCYSVLWESGAWGAGYFGDKTVTVGLQHNGYEFRTVTQTTTGAIIVLGPSVFVYTPASPIYGVMEAKSLDTFSAFLTQEDISEGYPWIGQDTGLHGFFYNPMNPPTTFLTITLIALAEG